MKRYAVRNLRLCTKDCLCLYVCPTGATDTEDSIIDVRKCVGCGVCADACPSKAISLVPEDYPPQQPKKESVLAALEGMARSKSEGERTALALQETAKSDGLYRLMKAVEKSERLVAEDIWREAGYMLPQSANTHELLNELTETLPEGVSNTAKTLFERIENNEKSEETTMKNYKCLVCGAEFAVEEGKEPVCPVCGAKGDKLQLIESKSNPYAGT